VNTYLEDGDVLLRNDQLTRKAANKAKGKRGGRKAKGGKKPRKGKKGKLSKKKTVDPSSLPSSSKRSPPSRKRKTLLNAKTSPSEPSKPPSVSKPKGKKQKVTESCPAAGRSAEDHAKPQRKPRATKAEKVKKPKSPVKPKAKAKAKSASARASSSKCMAKMAKTKHSELFDETLTDQLSAFAKTFSPDSDFKSDVFKTFMRSQVDPPENFPLNIYWTSASCGCKDKAQSKDIHSFTFNSVPSPHVYRLAVAVKCAELSAAHFAYKGFQDKTLQARKCLRWLKQMAFCFKFLTGAYD